MVMEVVLDGCEIYFKDNLSELRAATQGPSRMIADVLTYRIRWMEETGTARVFPGRGLDRTNPKLTAIIAYLSQCIRLFRYRDKQGDLCQEKCNPTQFTEACCIFRTI